MTELIASSLSTPSPPGELDASGLPPLPAPARLKRVLEAIAQTLPGDVASVLAANRFAPGAAALARLSQPKHRDAALPSLAPAEAEWLASELLRRWAQLGPPRLPPAIAIRVPEEVRAGDRTERILLRLCAEGILPEWTARWHGAEPAPDGASASVTQPPATSGEPAPISVRVHVHARGVDGARHVLVAEATIVPRVG
jgi:hypothetical protein